MTTETNQTRAIERNNTKVDVGILTEDLYGLLENFRAPADRLSPDTEYIAGAILTGFAALIVELREMRNQGR